MWHPFARLGSLLGGLLHYTQSGSIHKLHHSTQYHNRIYKYHSHYRLHHVMLYHTMSYYSTQYPTTATPLCRSTMYHIPCQVYREPYYYTVPYHTVPYQTIPQSCAISLYMCYTIAHRLISVRCILCRTVSNYGYNMSH